MRSNRQPTALGLFSTSLVFLASSAQAQELSTLEATEEGYVPPIADEPLEEGRPQGVTGRLTTGAQLSVNDNRSVVGQTDGSTFTFGFKFDSGVDVNEEAHEWRNTILIQEGLTQTPVVDHLVKTADTVDFETIYLYHIAEWWGPFARFGLNTSAFRGDDVRPAVTTYQIGRLDGTQETIIADRLALTDPFQPLRLKESLGLFLRALSSPSQNLEFRLGLGARETLAKGQLVVSDDEATEAIIEVSELDDSYAIGVEGAAEYWGALYENKLSYRLGAEVLIPFVTSELPPGDDRTNLDLTTVELGAGLSLKVVEWASVDYELKAVREPLLVDELQVQNNLLLTFGISYGTPDKAAAE
jgi:hypothetical protein